MRTFVAVVIALLVAPALIFATWIGVQNSLASAQDLDERLDRYVLFFWSETIGGGDEWISQIMGDALTPLRALNPGQEHLVDEAFREAFVDGMLAISSEPRQAMAEAFRHSLTDDELSEMLDFFSTPTGERVSVAYFAALKEAVFSLPDLRGHMGIAVVARLRNEFEERGLRYE